MAIIFKDYEFDLRSMPKVDFYLKHMLDGFLITRVFLNQLEPDLKELVQPELD